MPGSPLPKHKPICIARRMRFPRPKRHWMPRGLETDPTLLAELKRGCDPIARRSQADRLPKPQNNFLKNVRSSRRAPLAVADLVLSTRHASFIVISLAMRAAASHNQLYYALCHYKVPLPSQGRGRYELSASVHA